MKTCMQLGFELILNKQFPQQEYFWNIAMKIFIVQQVVETKPDCSNNIFCSLHQLYMLERIELLICMLAMLPPPLH